MAFPSSVRTERPDPPPGPLRDSGVPALAAIVLLAHLTLLPRIAGLDSFYHIGHTAHYLESGLTATAFPWATQSVVMDLGADLWWGFHILLLPFALASTPPQAIHFAAPILTLVLAGTVVWVLRRHAVRHAGWWAVVLFLAVPNVLYRFLMVRPHVLSLAAALLLLSFLVRGRWWQIAAAAAALVWIHLGLFWMPLGMACAYGLSSLRRRPGRVALALGAVLAGTATGWVLRPNPMGAAGLAWTQIVRLFSEKATEQPLLFAGELLPLPVADLLRSAPLFAALWLGGVTVWLARLRRPEKRLPDDPGVSDAPADRTFPTTALLISAAFLAVTLLSARRALVEWVFFGALALPFIWEALGAATRLRGAGDAASGSPVAASRRTRAVIIGMVLILGVHLAWAAQRHRLNTRLVAFPPDVLSGASRWLAARAEPGDTVFHLHWDNFGPLFAWNRSQRYIGGMDPIFQYAHSPRRYWEYFFLSADLTTEWTCDAFPCYEGTATDTYTAIRRNFGARWVVIEPQRNPKLLSFLRTAPGFTLAVDTGREIVFRVADDAPEGP